MVKEIQLDKLDLHCPNCGQNKKFDAHNGHCDGFHTIFLRCKNRACNYEWVICDGMLINKDGSIPN